MRKWSLALLICLCSVSALSAQMREQERIRDAASVMTEITRVPDRGIPTSLMQEAQAIMIFPNVVRAGFMVGVRHGRGIVMARDAQGMWGLPVMITMTGGNFGAQIGVQATDLVLMFKTRRGVDSIMRGRQLTLGADASVSAGPVGRNLAAATDTSFRTEILSWSRSRGLFAGVAIDGSSVRTDHSANSALYGNAVPSIDTILNGQIATAPVAANDLRNLMFRLAPPSNAPPAVQPK